ncbi:hypothetical protein FB451DRAFT_545311 [Mycena latifolia]|nr:hypothetical protein FB451DRAFT_545311 [Mycena latifolia]
MPLGLCADEYHSYTQISDHSSIILLLRYGLSLMAFFLSQYHSEVPRTSFHYPMYVCAHSGSVVFSRLVRILYLRFILTCEYSEQLQSTLLQVDRKSLLCPPRRLAVSTPYSDSCVCLLRSPERRYKGQVCMLFFHRVLLSLTEALVADYFADAAAARSLASPSVLKISCFPFFAAPPLRLRVLFVGARCRVYCPVCDALFVLEHLATRPVPASNKRWPSSCGHILI